MQGNDSEIRGRFPPIAGFCYYLSMNRPAIVAAMLIFFIIGGVFSCGRVSSPSPEPVAPTIRKILPNDLCVYQGAFLGEEDITAAKIEAFEAMSEKKLDIVLKFIAFNQMGTAGGFPLSEASTVAANGSVIFIKLEPWSWTGADDDSFSLEKIIAGDFDARIEAFASAAAAHGEPIFVSFGHEMNAGWYPWGGNPELYKQAYVRVHGLMSALAGNITWVWNPDMFEGTYPISSYYPGDAYVDWVAVDGYNTEDYGEPWKTAEQLFNAAVIELESYNKPLMIGETACDGYLGGSGNHPDKPQWLYDSVAWITGKNKTGSSDNLIKAFVYFNFDKLEGTRQKYWAISTADAKEKYKQALDDHSSYFKGIDP
jgi:hypothetical protein